MPKIEFRDVLALLALGVIGYAMYLEAHAHPVAEWLRTPLGTVVSVVLGFYFVDSARRAQGSAVQAPAAPAAPQPAPQPVEAAPAPPVAD